MCKTGAKGARRRAAVAGRAAFADFSGGAARIAGRTAWRAHPSGPARRDGAARTPPSIGGSVLGKRVALRPRRPAFRSRTIHAAGCASSFFICGDCTKVVEEVCDVGTHAFAVDEQMNLNFIRDIARKHGKGFGGNLKLTLALSLGLISPREDALISLAAGGTEGYTFAPG